MKIGIDFDNTIVNYDRVFYSSALELNLIPKNLKKSKLVVRDYLREMDMNDVWTDLQGFVYGEKMKEAEIFDGFIEFLNFARNKSFSIVIISHKTRYPYSGKKYDLHVAAEEWILDRLSETKINFKYLQNFFFLSSKEEKVDKIAQEKCDYFIDDLPEIFEIENFPKETKKILFDPLSSFKNKTNLTRVKDWHEFTSLIQKNAV